MSNAAMDGHYEMFTREGVTHLFKTANADSRDANSWAKVTDGESGRRSGDLSVELQRISGSPNAWLPGAWPHRELAQETMVSISCICAAIGGD
jgi:hypothetical protein